MSYQVTARKWRPMVFEDVVGQSHVTATLINAIKTKRVAHAYVFSGQRGCGKTTTARILAKALNCLSPNDANPDNACEVCKEITDGRSLDVIEIDGASNRGVEEIRNLRESVRYAPARGKYKVYIIDEVHMLTKEAFNALLKTLEEPPPHVVFVFATTEIHKVPATILSRCQRFDFRRIAIDEIITRLRFIAKEETVTIDDDALLMIAKKGDGSLRDAQSIFDQVRSFCGNTIATADAQKVLHVVDLELFFRVTDLVKAKDVRGAIGLVDELTRSGHDMREFLNGLSEHFRNLLVVRTTESTQLVETSEPFKKRYEEEAKRFSENDLLRLIKLTIDLEQSIRWSSQPRYKLEAGILQMVKMNSAVQVEELLRQIDDLKKKLNGSPKLSSPPPAVQTEVKVVGTVSAGRLRTSAAQAPTTSEQAVPAYAFPASPASSSTLMNDTSTSGEIREPAIATYSAPLSAPPRPATLQTISAEQAYSRWQDWVAEVQRSRISVGAVLSESSILDVSNGAVRIACPDAYHYTSLKRSREFLTETFQRVTGVRVPIEPVLHSQPAPRPSPSPTMIAQRREETAPGEEHPVIAALKRELGAEKVE
jgi:DNA polymerase-3 subunit gamma/tau